MKKNQKLTLATLGTMALSMLVVSSAFAETRPQEATLSARSDVQDPSRARNGRDEIRVEERRNGDDRNGGWRDGNRGQRDGVENRRNITAEGKVTRLDREGDGYRVQLDRGNYSFFVPDAQVNNARRGRNSRELRIGVSIRLGGYYDPRGYVYATSADWLDDDYYDDRGYRDDRYNDNYNDNDYLRGYVERVDYRHDVVLLRDERSGRRIAVDMHSVSRRSADADELRRGDFVRISGEWRRNGVFDADHVRIERDRRRW